MYGISQWPKVSLGVCLVLGSHHHCTCTIVSPQSFVICMSLNIWRKKDVYRFCPFACMCTCNYVWKGSRVISICSVCHTYMIWHYMWKFWTCTKFPHNRHLKTISSFYPSCDFVSLWSSIGHQNKYKCFSATKINVNEHFQLLIIF